MSLPGLYRQPQTDEQWSGWAFNHAANHNDWIQTVQTQKGQQLQQFLLDPLDPQELGMWLYNHQTMHDQVNSVLGTQGFNLLSLDWSNPDEFAMWLRLNGDEHVRVSALLGVG